MADFERRISKTANKNHEELFTNHKSNLKISEPELIEVFDNFAFDEVLAYGRLYGSAFKRCFIRILRSGIPKAIFILFS